MIRTFAGAVVLAFGAAAAACSSGGSATSDGGGGTGGSGGAGACAAASQFTAAAPQCNTLTNNATAVPFTAASGTPPAPTGGTIRDGLYVATRADGYGSATPAGRRLTLAVLDGATRLMFSGDVLDAAGSQTTLTFQANATAAVSGTQIAVTVTCMSTASSPLPQTLTFTANGDQLALGNLMGNDGAITTYMRTGCP